jgi:uncharacterized protein YcbK (DUF882 family)
MSRIQRRRLLGCACCAAGGLLLPALARGGADAHSGADTGLSPGAAGLTTAAAAAGSASSRATVAPTWQARLLRGARTLWLVRGDAEIRSTYWTPENGYDGEAYQEICWLMRDIQANKTFPMSPRLLDVLCGLQNWLASTGVTGPIHVNSGYRTFATNIRTEGSAMNSRHLLGRAADIRVPGVTLSRLAGMASLFGKGGVGMYLSKRFVHVDTGDERIWIK